MKAWLAVLVAIACQRHATSAGESSSPSSEPSAKTPAISASSPSTPVVDAAASPPRPAAASRGAWRKAYDWDGDGLKDEVVTEFSGGAHCCYRVGVRFASDGATRMLPFSLDGGLVPPEDLPDRPERFSIRVGADGIPEMVMEIETYNGEPKPLPAELTNTYGIRSHRVVVNFRGRIIRIRDASP